MSRTVLVATAAWVAVVAVGSVLVWTVISRAGDVDRGPGTAVPAATGTPRGGPSSHAGSHSTSPSPSAGGPKDGPTDGPRTGPERRTWQGAGGYVSVECRGPVISLGAAQADAGFAVEVSERGPEEVTVSFEGQGDEGRESEVKAVCRAGVPEFEVSTGE